MREPVGARCRHRVIDYHILAVSLMLHERMLLLVISRVLNVVAQHLPAEIHVRLVQMLMIVVYDVIVV